MTVYFIVLLFRYAIVSIASELKQSYYVYSCVTLARNHLYYITLLASHICKPQHIIVCNPICTLIKHTITWSTRTIYICYIYIYIYIYTKLNLNDLNI